MKRRFGSVLCSALLLMMLVQTVGVVSAFATQREAGATQYYVYRATGKMEGWGEFGDPALSTNAFYGSKVKLQDVFYPNNGFVYLPDGARSIPSYSILAGRSPATGGNVTNPAYHKGVPGRIESRDYPILDNDDNPVLDAEGNPTYETVYGKAFGENLKIELEEFKAKPLDTTGLGAVNLSIVYGRNPLSNASNVVGDRLMEVYVTLEDGARTAVKDADGNITGFEDSRTWLGPAYIRSAELLGGGMLRPSPAREGVFYRIETENLLEIQGVTAGDVIKSILIMPYGQKHYTFREVNLSEVAVNAYQTVADFERLVPEEEIKTTYVEPATLRQIAVNEGVRTATIPWTTEKAVLTQHPGSAGQPVYHYYMPGYTYLGPTYERKLDATRELFESSIVNGEYGYNGAGYTVSTAYGMDCQTFVYNCVSRVSRTSAWAVMNTPGASRISLVGDLKAKYPITFPDVDVILRNTEQELYESYALAQAGDITAGIKMKDNGGHTRLVKSVHVVRNEDGTIDPKQSHMYCTEQASIPKYLVVYDDGNIHLEKEIFGVTNTSFTLEDGTKVNGTIQYGHSSRHNSKYSFESMRNSNYLVYTLDEYRTGLVEDVRVEAVLGSRTADLDFVAGGANIGISSKYRVISYEVNVVNADTDETVFESGLIYCKYNKSFVSCHFNYKSDALDNVLAALPNGNYRLDLMVDSGPFTTLEQTKVPRTTKSFDFEVDQDVMEPGDVLYLLGLPQKSGGMVGGYNVASPADKIAVRYNGYTSTDSILPHMFYEVDAQGKLSVHTLYTKPTMVGYHNYFTGYDAETKTLTLTDAINGHGVKSGCNFTCSANLGNGGKELPMTLTNVEATMSVADVTGTEHGIRTLQDVIDLSANHRIRINHCVVDGAAALFVDEVKEVCSLADGDIIYVAGLAQPGTSNECYIVESDTLPVGEKVLVNFPQTGDYAHGYQGEMNGRFWEMKNGQLKRVMSVWYKGRSKGTFGYHEQFVSVEETSLTITNATGHTGTGRNCVYKFSESCEYTKKRADAYECGVVVADSSPKQYTVGLTEDTVVIDTRTGVKTAQSSLDNIVTLAQTGEVVMNLYCNTPHEASVIVIIDYFPVMYDITVAQAANGTVSVDKTSAGFGTTVTVTATPDENYVLEHVLVDGVAIEGNTFTVSGEHTVTASFVERVQPGDLVFLVDGPEEASGTATVYHPSQPTVAMQYVYTSVDSLQDKRFYRVTERKVLALAEQAEDVLLNMDYAGYDTQGQILYLIDAHGNVVEVSAVAADLPVLDVSGETALVTTVMEVAGRAVSKRVRMHVGLLDGFVAVYVVEQNDVDGIPLYMLQNGDSVFVPTAKKGTNNVGYLANSGTLPVGTPVKIAFPESGDYAHGYNSEMNGRFWEKRGGKFKRVMSVWYTGAPDGTYGYHETIEDIYDDKIIINNATGHTGLGKNCLYGFNESCHYSVRGHCRECGENLPYLKSFIVTMGKDLKILDMRTGKGGGQMALEELTGLAATGEVVVNLYCGTPDQASVIFLLEHIPDPLYTITTEASDGGTVTVDKTEAEAGETITITATPAEGYRLMGIKVDGAAIIGNTYTVTGNHEVTAEFAKLLNFASTSANVGDVLDLNFRMTVTDVDFEGGYAILTGPQGEQRVDRADWQKSGTRYNIPYKGMFATMMADEVAAVVYDDNGNQMVAAQSDSIRGYTMRALNTYGSNPNYAKLCVLLVDMLVYGATAQEKFSHNQADPADSLLSDAQRALATVEAKPYQSIQEKSHTGNSASATLGSRIELNFTFLKSDVPGAASAKFTFDHAQSALGAAEVTVPISQFVDSGTKWKVVLNALVAADGRQPVRCEVLDADGNVIAWSVDTVAGYVARLIGSNASYKWVESMVIFCDSAYGYFCQ